MKLRQLIALLAILALVAGSCGGGGLEAAAECDGEIPSGSTVTVWMHEGSEYTELDAAMQAFNTGRGSELGLTVEVVAIPEEASWPWRIAFRMRSRTICCRR